MPATTRVLLLIVLFLPLAAALLVPLFGRAARRAALFTATLHFLLTFTLLFLAVPALNFRSEHDSGFTLTPKSTRNYDAIKMQPDFVPGDYQSTPGLPNRTSWTLLNLVPSPPSVPGPRIQFYIGLDGFNIWLIGLSSLMTLAAVLMSWDSIQERPGAFYGWLLLLQGTAIGAFLSFDVILFLRLLRADVDPGVLPHRRLGDRLGSARRRSKVLPLHLRRQSHHAGRRHRHRADQPEQ